MLYKHGIDCIDDADVLLNGKRLGLITNYTGVNSEFVRTVDILKSRYNLIKLFAPEHGLYGIQQAGAEIVDIVDEKSRLPVLSMFKKGNTIDLSGLDLIVYDIQDIGLRFFTHISLLSMAMKECAKAQIPMVILDRYNPLGLNRLNGTVLQKEFSSFVGMYEIPAQYGMTVGEYARYINSEENIGCQLEIVSCKGLKRSDDFSSLHVEWITPSPNCPTIQTARAFIGMVLFEGTNVSEGRGTTRPFEFIGAPWIDEYKLADQMNSKKLSGVVFRPVRFMPTFSKYTGECCCGVQIHITDWSKFDSFYCGMALLDTIRREYKEFESTDFLSLLLGTNEFTTPHFEIESFISKHRKKTREFAQKAQKYHLYK